VGINVTKGASVPLDADGSGLTQVNVGLGWDPAAPGGEDFDLDASAIALTEAGTAPSRAYFVYYNNLTTPRREIVHRGDSLTGENGGDDEQIDVHLEALSTSITRIVFPVSIHNAEYRGQSFGDVRNAYIRVVDAGTGRQIARYDLSTDAATETAMLFGELYRDDSGWHFLALGQGRLTGLVGIAREYGVDV
jgi:tellurium resistance protein TerD